jgi:hypothetical protein
MLTRSTPLIELDWANFRPWAVTPVKHTISDHPLFQIDKLVALAQRLEARGEIRAHKNDAKAGTPFGAASDLHPVNTPLIQSLEHIEAARAWMSLLNVQTDAVYRGLVDEVLGSIGSQVEAKDPGMSYRGGWIFVTSPRTVTPFHIDKEHNFILQVKGRKKIYVWEPDDVRVVSAAARRRFHSRHDRDLIAWREEFRALAHCFDVGPGEGAYMPSTSPHLVEVGEEPSITMSFTYYTTSTRRHGLIHKTRGRLGELGLNFPETWGNGRLDEALYRGASTAQSAARFLYRATGKKIGQETAPYAKAERM